MRAASVPQVSELQHGETRQGLELGRGCEGGTARDPDLATHSAWRVPALLSTRAMFPAAFSTLAPTSAAVPPFLSSDIPICNYRPCCPRRIPLRASDPSSPCRRERALREMDPHSEVQSALKRKRDIDTDQVTTPNKTAKTSSHLAINYLARQYSEDLPYISSDDTLPSILTLVENYHGVLDRHESLACNLGARALGPILIQRFERLFDGPPKVLKCHAREGTTVTWLDVVEFARNKPEQFTLGQMSEGTRVCQFYTKQCRMQITEEDFVLINSGIPQKMIPPQPIVEDEEKELGTLELVEKNMNTISKLADDGRTNLNTLQPFIFG